MVSPTSSQGGRGGRGGRGGSITRQSGGKSKQSRGASDGMFLVTRRFQKVACGAICLRSANCLGCCLDAWGPQSDLYETCTGMSRLHVQPSLGSPARHLFRGHFKRWLLDTTNLCKCAWRDARRQNIGPKVLQSLHQRDG